MESAGCEPGRQCPIMRGPCPGECVFADIMESQRLGVVAFDLAARSLLFVNRSARELFERLGCPADYGSLSGLLLPDGGSVPFASYHPSEPTRIGMRLLGHTAYQERTFAWAFVRDITDKARLESVAEAVETMNNIGYVFSAVRHELGNPINSVKAALSVLRANLRSYPQETVADYLERISAEVGRVEALLRSLKSFSIFERPQIEAVELGAFVRSFCELAGEGLRRRGVACIADVPGECWAEADPRALQQVLLNLFTNATDAVVERPNPEVRVSVASNDGLAHLCVADNGRGMTPEEIKNLFKPFYTSKETGTGLGLVITRKLLSKMNGTISVDSTEGEGTVIAVTLPQHRRETP